MRLLPLLTLVASASLAQQVPPIPSDAPAMGPKSPGWRILYLHDEDKTNLVLNDLVFTSPSRGVAAGYLQGTSRVQPVALLTSDGGRQWRTVELKDPALSVFFVDDSTGWIVTPKGLYVTAEGGAQWKKVGKLPLGMERVYFRTRDEGWAFGAGKSVYHTTDGAVTWAKVPESVALSLTDENTSFRTMEFVTPTRAMIVGNSQPKRPDRQRARIPDWLYPEAAMYRRQLPGTVAVLETKDGGKTWAPQVSSILGTVTRTRFAMSIGLVIFNYSDEFDWPAEVIRIDMASGSNNPVFRRKDRLVTDAAFGPDGTVYLAAIEPVGRVRTSPIPGKVHVLRSTDMKAWTEMPVDYRASGRRAILAASGSDLWLATDEGVILKLAP